MGSMLFRKAMPAGPVEYIVAGLGNPGKEYEGSRHNAGFMGMEALAGIFAGAVLIRFSVTRYQGERGMQVFDKLAMAGGIVLILLAAVRLVLMGLIAAGVLERGVLPFPQL